MNKHKLFYNAMTLLTIMTRKYNYMKEVSKKNLELSAWMILLCNHYALM